MAVRERDGGRKELEAKGRKKKPQPNRWRQVLSGIGQVVGNDGLLFIIIIIIFL